MVGTDVIKHVLMELENKINSNKYDKSLLLDATHNIHDCLDDISNTNNFMIMAINRCIDYTKASKGMKLVPKYETLHLSDTLRMPLLCMKNVQNKISIIMNPIPPNVSHQIITDKQWLQENLLCLLSNAAKYSNGGEVTINVMLLTEAEEQRAMKALGGTNTFNKRISVYRPNRSSLISEASNEGASSPLPYRATPGKRFSGVIDRFSISSTGRYSVCSIDRISGHSSFLQGVTQVDDECESVASDVVNGPVTTFLRFEIEDTGIGISEEAMHTLFSPFKQTQRLAGGTGLGLYSLAKRLDALNGRYGVTRRRDGKQGSLFWFAIPYRPDSSISVIHEVEAINNTLKSETHDSADLQEAPAAVAEHSFKSDETTVNELTTEAPNKSTSEPSTKDGNKLNILIVDDSPAIIKVTSMMLRRQGHLVSAVDNGALAVKKVEDTMPSSEGINPSERFDVVLMDLQMPVMDGLEAIKRIRTAEKQRNITSPALKQRIIGVSACSDHDTMQEAFTAGIDAFMGKPFNVEQFDRTVKQLLSPLQLDTALSTVNTSL